MTHDTIIHAFHGILERGGTSRTATFAPGGEDDFVAAYARVAHFVERTKPEVTAGEAAVLGQAGLPDLSVWSHADMVRACMLISHMANTPETKHAPLVRRLFREGDLAEREALLRSLSLLPGPRRFLDTAMEAHRVAFQSVFEALACENAYPATQFSEPAFNQMVVKALFLGIKSERIWGLATRVNAELVRMTEAYASERAAAGRPIPQDVHFIVHTISTGVH